MRALPRVCDGSMEDEDAVGVVEVKVLSLHEQPRPRLALPDEDVDDVGVDEVASL